MNNDWKNRTRTSLFLALAVTLGSAQAGVLEVGQLAHSAKAARNGTVTFNVANAGAEQIADVNVYVNGQNFAGACSNVTARGNAFAPAGALAAGDSVDCSGAIAGHASSITVQGKGANGATLGYTAHQVFSTAAVPSQSRVGILLGAVFNDTDLDQHFDANETISLSYTVFNFGNTALSSISVSDDLGTVISCPQTTLAIGGSMKCTGTHTISAGEASGVAISTTATVDAQGAGTQFINSDDSVIRTSTTAAEVRGLKSPLFTQDNDGNTVAGPGDLVHYTFAIKNSGSLMLNPVNMLEADPTRIDGNITCDSTTLDGAPFSGLGTGALNVGDAVLCSADYTITDADVQAGEADNLANITGQPIVAGNPSGGVASGSAASALVVPAGPQLTAAPTPVNDWRALLLLALGMLGIGFVASRRKTQTR
jgi:hypothetical protein